MSQTRRGALRRNGVSRLAAFSLLLLSAAMAAFSETRDPSAWTIGLSERFRYVTWDNVETLDREAGAGRAVLSFRTRLSINWGPSERLDIGFRLANEVQQVLVPSGGKFELNEVFIDNLYVMWRAGEEKPFDLTLGRQNMLWESGLLVAEGTPLDETRSAYFNALRLDVGLGLNQFLTGFVCYQPEKDSLLPILNSLNRPLVEQPETGLGLRYSWMGSKKEAEASLVYKNAGSSAAWPALNLLTLDGRGAIRPLSGLSVEGEAAVQFGRRGGASLAAWGLDIESRWEASRALPFLRQVAGGLVFLSGDDPGSGGWEGWVPPFSRWPAWSESYIFTLAADNDGRLAEWTNFVSLYGRLELELTKRLDLSLGIQRLLATQASSGTWDMAKGGGRVRGNLWIFRLGFMFSDHLAGHLLYEGFTPGDYYLGEADGYSFLRLELQLLI